MATGSAKLAYSSGFYLETLSGFSLIVKGGQDLMRSRYGFYSKLGYCGFYSKFGHCVFYSKFGHCGFYSKLGHCEGLVEELGEEVGEVVEEASPCPSSPLQ